MQGKETEPTDDDRKLVESLSGLGLPLEQIAALVCGGINRETLAKHFQNEIVTGKAKANSRVAKTLFQKITEDNDTTAMIWWTKTQMGWKETQVQEVKQETPKMEIIVTRASRENKT